MSCWAPLLGAILAAGARNPLAQPLSWSVHYLGTLGQLEGQWLAAGCAL